MEEAAVGVGEELFVALEDCVPMVKVPCALLVKTIAALSNDLHLRSQAVQDTVRELKTYVNG